MPSTLSKQLKIKPAMRIMLLNSPPDYVRALGALPADVVVVANPRGPVDMVQLFCRSMAELKEGLPQATGHVKDGGIFVDMLAEARHRSGRGSRSRHPVARYAAGPLSARGRRCH